MIKMQNGLRVPVLLENGIPHFYSTLHISREFLNTSHNTKKNVLECIRLFIQWLKNQDIQIEQRLAEGNFLNQVELERLLDFLNYDKPTISNLCSGVAIHPRSYKFVSVKTYRNRAASIKNYLKFLYRFLSSSEERKQAEIDLDAFIKTRQPRDNSYKKIKEEKAISDKILSLLFNAIEPSSSDNPWTSDLGIRVRNQLIVCLLYETGIRRGELLGIRISDINFQSNQLAVKRRHDALDDSRLSQPNTKTRERNIPLSDSLIDLMHEYVSKHRGVSKRAKRHELLFVSHKRNKGEPLSLQSLNLVFRTLNRKVEDLSGLHPHLFRHHMNYKISKLIDEKFSHLGAEDKAATDAQIRSYHMGWSSTGNSQEHYNKRYAREKANEALRNRDIKLALMSKKDEGED
ncbi:tyrosine-type recombinase/integrase [Alteromonas portus]|nr:tyrosine-type recombinase/integrase [Alteromonas portus]